MLPLLERRPNVAICIPLGDQPGGVKTWAWQLFGRLPGGDPILFLHPGLSAWTAHLGRVWQFARRYRTALPATFVPSWTHGTYAACALLSRKRANEMRVIGVAHSDDEHFFRHLAHYEPMIHRFVAVSDEVGERLRHAIPHRAEHIQVRRNAVPVPGTLARGYTAGPLRMVYAGRFEQNQKRVLDLLALADLLCERGVNFRLDLYGEGPSESQLRKAWTEMPAAIRRHVQLHASVPWEKMGEVWAKADVCLLTSAFEGTSMSMLEAMAHGCVPVVTRVSGVRAVISPGVNGYYYEVGELYDLAGYVQTLAEDRSALERMGWAARATIASHFGIDEYAAWFSGLVAQAWRDAPRAFPRERKLIPQGAPTMGNLWRYYTKRWLLKKYVAMMDGLGLKTPRRNSPLLKS